MVDEILSTVRRGGQVCVAFYGHPGVFVNPSHEAIRRARDEGFDARMVPSVSADACLFADLGVDPSEFGCQSYEATDMLARGLPINPSVALILWQVGVIGNMTYAPEGDLSRIPVLVDYLERFYPADHEIVCYEAALYPVCDPSVERVPLDRLGEVQISPMSTLYVAPAVWRSPDPEMQDRLFQIGAADRAGIARN